MASFSSAAIVGSGFIGTSWALLMARAGVEVRVFDESAAQLAAARKRVASSPDHGAPAGGSIVFCDTLATAISGVDYVQEAVPEQLDVKQEVFAEVDGLLRPEVPIGSSTSAYTMSQIAERVVHPQRCLVVHPTNPPHIVPLVEVVPSPQTDPLITRRVYKFLQELGQQPILCQKEIFGFVLNRLQFALLREAFFLVREGVASVADVDKTVREGLGLRWAFLGPYGVEATNAASIEDDLRKFGTLIRDLFEDVCRPFDGPDDDDIAMAVVGVQEMFGDATQGELIAYRDRMVRGVRALKDADAASPFGKGRPAARAGADNA